MYLSEVAVQALGGGISELQCYLVYHASGLSVGECGEDTSPFESLVLSGTFTDGFLNPLHDLSIIHLSSLVLRDKSPR